MARNIIDLRKRGSTSRPVRPRPLPPQSERKEKRSSPLRARRRRARVVAAVAALTVVAALAYGIHWLSYIPQFNVSRVIVSGAERVPSELVRAYVDSRLHDGSYRYLSSANIALYSRESIEKGIVAFFPMVREAHISRDSPIAQAVSVLVVERRPFAQWCLPEEVPTEASSPVQDCYEMDDGGFIFAAIASTTHGTFETPYVFSGDIVSNPIGKTFIPGHLPGILALLRIIGQRADFTPLAVGIEGEQDFSVHFSEGFTLKASFGQDADTLARNLALILSSEALAGKESELEYVDLRFGNRVYYKLKGEEQVQQ